MATTRRSFEPHDLAAIDAGLRLRIRAGSAHRFIGIWAVVVDRRVFVRSWSLKPGGWYRAFLRDPAGAIEVGGLALPIRAGHPRSPDLLKRVDDAYRRKYKTPSALRYVRDLNQPRSKRTTTELIPA